MDENKLKKNGYSKDNIWYLKNDYRLYTEYIWEIKEDDDVWLQQEDHMYEREAIQKVLDKDPTIFTKEELLKIKTTDQFILDNIEDAARWFYFRTYKKHPKKHWWRYAHLIASGKMPKPNLDEIWEKYLGKVK